MFNFCDDVCSAWDHHLHISVVHGRQVPPKLRTLFGKDRCVLNIWVRTDDIFSSNWLSLCDDSETT